MNESMSNIYSVDHFCCYKYQDHEKPLLEILDAHPGQLVERDLNDTAITFLLRGSMHLSYDKVVDREIGCGTILLFPPGSHIKVQFGEETHLLVFRVKEIIQLCNCLTIQQLYDETAVDRDGFHVLGIHHRIAQYLDHLMDTVRDGIRCPYYYETKIKELFFLLLSCYPREELTVFFALTQSGRAVYGSDVP
ncbi:MAG: hypothetical protein LUD68_04565 [Rikenellaceae bacterium]|nr:hypothetical protein [Rikenellaceae bacterium]